MLSNALIGAVTSQKSAKVLGLPSRKTSAAPTIGTLACIIMYTRKPALRLLQEMNALQMWLSSCKREMFSRFNHLGLCAGVTATRSSIDRIRKEYDEEVYEWKTRTVDYLSGMTVSCDSQQTIPYVESEADVTDIEEDLPIDTQSPLHIPIPVAKDELARPGLAHDSRSSDIGHESMDLSISDVGNNSLGRLGYSICFDNVNTKVTVRHQTKDRRNKMFNKVQAYAAEDRVPTLHLPDLQPAPPELLDIPLSVYFPSEMDEISLMSEMTTHVTRVLSKNIPAFSEVKAHVNQHLLHPFTKESSKKSTMVPLGVLDMDECRLDDMIEIMQDYHKYVPLKPDGDPLTIPLHADGLSCERGNDAQMARINSNNAWRQLQGLKLNPQEWHKRCTLLQDAYDELYGGSSREKGTLMNLKNFFHHTGVSPNVKQSFNYNEEFLQFVGDLYITLAGIHLLGMNDLNSIPDGFPTEIDDQLAVMNSIASQIVDMVFISAQPTVRRILETDQDEDADEDGFMYCICQTDRGGEMVFCENRNCTRGTWFHLECIQLSEDDVHTGQWHCCKECKEQSTAKKIKGKRQTVADKLEDGKRNYVLLTMLRSLNQKVRRDAIRENDGERLIMHWRFDMLQFFAEHHPKYFLLGQRLLAAMNGSVISRLKHTLMWNRTVNPNGGIGKNLAMDLQMEYFNKQYKESVKDASGVLTESTAGSSGRKSQDINRDKDLAEFVSNLQGEDLFTPHPGRKFLSFPNATRQIYQKINPQQVRKRLRKHTGQMSQRLQVVLANQGR